MPRVGEPLFWGTAFGAQLGCQHADLQAISVRYLAEISDGTLKLELSPSRETKGNESGVEKIEKIILTQNDNRDYVRRTLRQLSGGQRHRISLSFSLGFLHLIQNRRWYAHHVEAIPFIVYICTCVLHSSSDMTTFCRRQPPYEHDRFR